MLSGLSNGSNVFRCEQNLEFFSSSLIMATAQEKKQNISKFFDEVSDTDALDHEYVDYKGHVESLIIKYITSSFDGK